MTPSFPLALHLEGRSCLVVGSSPEAARRLRAFLEAGAEVRMVSERPCAELREATRQSGVSLHQRAWDPTDLEGQWLAVLADDDEALARRLAEACAKRRVFFCAIDASVHNTFSHLALARSGVVTTAVGTNGQAPALARRLAEELARLFERSGLAAFADELAELRRRTPSEARRDVLGRAVAGVRIEGQLRLDPEPKE